MSTSLTNSASPRRGKERGLLLSTSVCNLSKSGLGVLILGLVSLVFYYLIVQTFFLTSAAAIENANTIGPIALISMIAVTIYGTVRRFPVAVWTPYILYLIQSAIFFGLGPLVYKFGNEATLRWLEGGLLPITEFSLLKTNVLNTVAIASATIGFFLISRTKRFRRPKRASPTTEPKEIGLAALTIFFLIIGAFLKYLIILPYSFGMTSFVVPGSINNLANLYELGLSLVAYLSVKKKTWRIVLWVLLPLHLSIVFLEFSKTSLIISLLLPALGAYLCHNSIKRLAIWGAAIFLLFYLVQPFIQYGRSEIFANTETIHRATLQERIEITRRFLQEQNALTAVEKDAAQVAWMRLAYAGPQAFAMQEYDEGRPGDSLKAAWIVFVPRAIWPEKPEGIGPGEDFYELVTGRRGTHLGLSVYGDLYWQYGWTGVILLSSVMGVLFAYMSKSTLTWIHERQLIFLPAMLVSMLMALDGPTKYFINGILGGFVIYASYIFAINVYLKSTRRRIIDVPTRTN